MQQVNVILSRFTPLIKHRSRMLSVQWGSLAGISYMVTTNTGQPRSNKLQKKQEIPSKQKRPPTTDTTAPGRRSHHHGRQKNYGTNGRVRRTHWESLECVVSNPNGRKTLILLITHQDDKALWTIWHTQRAETMSDEPRVPCGYVWR